MFLIKLEDSPITIFLPVFTKICFNSFPMFQLLKNVLGSCVVCCGEVLGECVSEVVGRFGGPWGWFGRFSGRFWKRKSNQKCALMSCLIVLAVVLIVLWFVLSIGSSSGLALCLVQNPPRIAKTRYQDHLTHPQDN